MLAARRAMIDEVNRKFGTDITVDFSGAWRAEVTRYEDISGEAEIDGTEAGTDPESNKESEDTNDESKEDTVGNTEESDDNESV